MTENQSGLEPRGRALLVRTYEPERKKSIIAIPGNVQERTDMLEQRCIVVAVGESCWHDEKVEEPVFFGLFTRKKIVPRAKVGDKVIVTKFAGYFAIGPADGKRYRLVNDRDVFCAITAERSQEVIEQERKVASG